MRPIFHALLIVCALLPAPTCFAAGSDPLHTAVARERARPPAPRFSRAAFLVRSATPAVALSPDGRQVAYLREQDGHRSLWVLPAGGGEARRLVGSTDGRRIDWSHDGRWLLLESPGQLFAVAAAAQGGSGLVATLGGRDRRELLRIDPLQPAAVLLRERVPATLDAPARWRLVRADMQGRRTLLREDTQQLVDAAFDRNGRLAFVERVEGAALVFHRVDAQGALHGVLDCRQLHRCEPLPVTDAQGRLLLRSDLGDGLEGLRRLEPDGTLATLHEDPRGEADLDTLALDPADGTPRIASYRGTVATSLGLDAPARHALAGLEASFPGRNLEIAIGATHWLVVEQASTLQGARWHLYDVR